MSTYIWIYEARLEPNGIMRGRIEAKSFSEAVQKVKDNNLMVNSVTAKLHKNQNQARKEKFEVYA